MAALDREALFETFKKIVDPLTPEKEEALIRTHPHEVILRLILAKRREKALLTKIVDSLTPEQEKVYLLIAELIKEKRQRL